MTLLIPDAALDERLAIVGTSGSGKTYGAKGLAERLLASTARVCIGDPLGVWWGLKSSADGSGPGFPVTIFGAPHGDKRKPQPDVPITEHAGAAVAEIVAESAGSTILDLSDLPSGAARRRFMTAFMERLYERNREPLHLILDEADLWAPQRPGPDQLTLFSRVDEIVRRGRVRGFIPWLITQRPAVLHKDVLSQADILFAFKLTSSQDRAALGAWIEGQADKAQERRFLAELPKLQKGTGQAMVWDPGRGVLDLMQFPRIKTFDSSRTPKRGEHLPVPKVMAAINVEAARARLATAIKEAEENDPKALKARIAELERVKASQIPTVDHAAIDRARAEGVRSAVDDAKKLLAGSVGAITRELHDLELQITRLADWMATAPQIAPNYSQPIPQDKPGEGSRTVDLPISRQRKAAIAPGTAMSKAERRILTALAQYPQGRSKVQVAVLAGYAVDGGGFNNALGSLRSQQRIFGAPERLEITPAGLKALGAYDPLPTGRALLAYWLSQLDKAPRLILEALANAYPRSMTKDQLAAATGYEASGGGFNNALGRLRTLELINRGAEIRASETLFGA